MKCIRMTIVLMVYVLSLVACAQTDEPQQAVMYNAGQQSTVKNTVKIIVGNTVESTVGNTVESTVGNTGKNSEKNIKSVSREQLISFADRRMQSVKIRDLYQKNRSTSPFAQDSEGKYIVVTGYMAPPLKAESSFFVLTKMPMSVCPFCETEADWPNDIIAVYTKESIHVEPFNRKIEVRGILRLDALIDKETGFYCKVRLDNAVYKRLD